MQTIAQFDEPVRRWKKSFERPPTTETDKEGAGGEESDSSQSTILLEDEHSHSSSNESNDSQLILEKQNEKPAYLPYYQIVGDNIDFEVKTKFMTLEKNRSLHWFNMVAVNERIMPPQHLSNEYPRCSMLSVPETAFLPTDHDIEQIRDEFIILFARTIVTYLEDFSGLRLFVDFHLPHEYSQEAAVMSHPVPLGIVEWNENKQIDMIEILKYVQQRYVPYTSEGPAVRVQLTGDLLTAERERAALRSLVDSSKAVDRVEGLLPHAEDFHCSMNFLDLIFNKFYKYSSGHNDCGTLLNLRALLGRKNVTSDPIHNFTPCNSFLEDVLDGHILAIAMHHFGMEDGVQVGVVDKVPEEERKKWFLDAVGEMVDSFVYTCLKAGLEKLRGGVQQVINGTDRSGRTVRRPRQQQNVVTSGGDIHAEPLTSGPSGAALRCRSLSPSHSLDAAHHGSDYTLTDHACLLNSITLEDTSSRADETHSARSHDKDEVFDYAANLITLALIEKDFKDASREMDGSRLFRLWKLKMLLFKENNRSKYALEGLYFQADQYALLSEQEAHRQLWNRGFNTKGGRGNNIALDLMVEHQNNYVKDMVHHQGANLTFKSAQVASRSALPFEIIMKNLDSQLGIKPESGEHTMASRRNDILKIAKHLLANSVVINKPGRVHSSFPKGTENTFSRLDPAKFVKWVCHQREQLHTHLGLQLH